MNNIRLVNDPQSDCTKFCLNFVLFFLNLKEKAETLMCDVDFCTQNNTGVKDKHSSSLVTSLNFVTMATEL